MLKQLREDNARLQMMIAQKSNEMDELRWVQQRYVEAMVEETNMTKKYLTKLLDRKVNAYLGAQEAVELGIADEIV